MKSRTYPLLIAFLAIAMLGHLRVGVAATFTTSPSTISNTYRGPITLQIGGLTNGESVVVDNYYDLNANHLIDTNDVLMGSFRLTDGLPATIGGVTNLNVPCDLTAT